LPRALANLADGWRVALVSDAGTPLVSDPGFRLVREAAAAGHPVRPIPGASALLAGLSVAGLPTDRFLFAGFPPPKSASRKTFLAEVSGVRATLVFFEGGS
ncbi:SAM-dependent methyltransferase, partial [Shewanella sp. A25]|nr:SAM-dependent methyltransferase [Shewanella shenzhenensis]